MFLLKMWIVLASVLLVYNFIKFHNNADFLKFSHHCFGEKYESTLIMVQNLIPTFCLVIFRKTKLLQQIL